MSLINVIGNTISGYSGGLKLPLCTRDLALSWHKDLNTTVTGTPSITGLLNFDGVNDYVEFNSHPNIVNGTISFYTYFDVNNVIADASNSIIFVENGGLSNNSIYILIQAGEGDATLIIDPGESSTKYGYDLTSYDLTISEIVIVKNLDEIASVTVNGNVLTPSTGVGDSYNDDDIIGYDSNDSGYGEEVLFWDIRTSSVAESHRWLGYPNGNLDSAWEDTIGSIDGTVYGSPTTINIGGYLAVKDSIGIDTRDVYYGQYLDTTSGQIDFYRNTGTFDYTDPSDGSLVEDVAIPATGLYTIPANGICEIITSDGSYYPICERAGTVLHDVKEDSKHISVATPSWSESLRGSDYLNQYGFVTKTESDVLGYDWETNVFGTDISLNNNALIPLAQWSYQNLQDNTGENILDSSGEQIQVKVNI